jgi:hypothetical protein
MQQEPAADDGASGNAAIRRRIAQIAAERNLDPSETKALMTGRRIPHHPLCQFAKKHHLSFDWLLGLLLRKLGDQKLVPAAVECLRVLLERHGTAS